MYSFLTRVLYRAFYPFAVGTKYFTKYARIHQIHLQIHCIVDYIIFHLALWRDQCFDISFSGQIMGTFFFFLYSSSTFYHKVRARINDSHPFGWSASSAVLFLFLFFGLFKWNNSDTRRHKITISFFYDSVIKKKKKTIMMMLIMMTKCHCLHYFLFFLGRFSFSVLHTFTCILSYDERRGFLFSFCFFFSVSFLHPNRMLEDVFAVDDEFDDWNILRWRCNVCIFFSRRRIPFLWNVGWKWRHKNGWYEKGERERERQRQNCDFFFLKHGVQHMRSFTYLGSKSDLIE